MRRFFLSACAIILVPVIASAQPASNAGPYQVLQRAKVGGDGGFDYVYADNDARRLYIARRGDSARMTVFDLDMLKSVGEIPNVNGHGAAVDSKTNHGFTTSKPMVMWDTHTLKPIKNIDVQGNPDGIFFDAFNQRVYSFSHIAPYATVIDSKDGSIIGTIDLGGAPEHGEVCVREAGGALHELAAR
jgi:DNA-binding beta-propeller fold protein YncE